MNVSEISCHGMGAFWLDNSIRTVFDIGAEDTKVILVDENGRVVDFIMNDKCAAGTGRCLEILSKAINLRVEDIGRVSLKSRNPINLTNVCLGARYFDLEVYETGDPIEAIAKRYLNKFSCPRMVNAFDMRIKFLCDTIREYKIDAVITEKLKFCDLWGVENMMMKESRKNGFPLLALERELYGDGIGQLKTRIQAFIEMVRNMKKAGIAVDRRKKSR
jgi:benzoyl-CoA reductase/2-hydroxyglutaryl-CoA dehydratase subunit BcrC/BadD/HgdB